MGARMQSTCGRSDAWVIRERDGWTDGRTRGCTDATKAGRIDGLMYSCERTLVDRCMIAPMDGLVGLSDDCLDVRAIG